MNWPTLGRVALTRNAIISSTATTASTLGRTLGAALPQRQALASVSHIGIICRRETNARLGRQAEPDKYALIPEERKMLRYDLFDRACRILEVAAELLEPVENHRLIRA